MNDTRWTQEANWPQPHPEQFVQLIEHSCQDLSRSPGKRVGRPARVSGNHLCLALLVCLLHGWTAQLQVWRLLVSEPLGRFAPVQVCDQAIYNRLARAVPTLQGLFEQMSTWLTRRLEGWQESGLAGWAKEVYAVDASTLDRLGRYLPWLRPLAQGDKTGLAGQISALLDVRRQQWVRVEFFANAKANCKEVLGTLLCAVPPGALLLFDRGYLSFAFFDQLTAQGFWWISRYANKVSYQVSHVCYQADGVLDAIVYLGVHRADQARYPVRLVQFWQHGRHYRYLTNVLDPRVLSVADLVSLYARRWDIELAFRLLKDHLHLRQVGSARRSVVQVYLWGCLILAQVYHALQGEIAMQAGVELFEVSLDLLVRLTPGWLARGQCPQEQAVRYGRQLGLIRPSTRHRIEVPWIEPAWVGPPPPEAVQPRSHVRHRPPETAPRQKRPGRT